MLPEDRELRFQMLKHADEVVPFYKLLGIRVEELRDGFARLTMPFRKELTQSMGVMHGGALASLADSAVAIALLTDGGPRQRVLTIEFKMNFFEPVNDGIVVAECKVIRRGGSLCYAEVDVKVGDRLVGRANSTYLAVEP